jgi:anti-sigma-K factor RskA
MTDRRDMTDEPRDIAAEYALGVLSGAEFADAHRRMSADAEFAAAVARWRGRLAPLGAEIEAVEPPPTLWPRISEALAGGSAARGANVVVLRRRLNLWRGAAAAMTALAASLAGVLILQPRPAPVIVQQPAGAPMVAMLADPRNEMKVMASWNPGTRQLVLAVAGDMPADSRHAHELWVIPAGGKPRSLGTMGGGKQMHMRLADAIAALMESGATVAISVEPPGGSPTGLPTGPVIASGALTKA